MQDLEDFNRFWSAYPRKRDKGAARRAWEKTARIRPALPVLLEKIAAQCQSPDWRKDGGQFIPYPATWLNGERWDDEVQINLGAAKAYERAEQPKPASVLPWYQDPQKIRARGAQLGIVEARGERFDQYRERVFAAVREQKALQQQSPAANEASQGQVHSIVRDLFRKAG